MRKLIGCTVLCCVFVAVMAFSYVRVCKSNNGVADVRKAKVVETETPSSNQITTYDSNTIFKDIILGKTTDLEAIQYAFSHHMSRVCDIDDEDATDDKLYRFDSMDDADKQNYKNQTYITKFLGYKSKLLISNQLGVVKWVELELCLDENMDSALVLDDIYNFFGENCVASGDITKYSKGMKKPANYSRSYILKDGSGVSITSWYSDECYITIKWRDEENRDKVTTYYKEDGNLYKKKGE